MGVRGLETLIENHSEKILKGPQYVRDTKLVIDGNGLEYYFLDQIMEAKPPMSREEKYELLSRGGEYQRLKSKIESFFQNLLDCNCTPIVVFDGSFDLDDMKTSTCMERFKKKIEKVKSMLEGKPETIKPPLVSRLMKQVMNMKHVRYARSTFEADREIVILANQLKCPVLGRDSDFCIMDIAKGYIPFNFLKIVEEGDGVQCSISAKIFHIEKLCSHFRIRKEFLPLLATLAGNDYVDSDLLETFRSNVYTMYTSNSCKCQRKPTRLEKLFSWIQEQDSIEDSLEMMLYDNDMAEVPYFERKEFLKLLSDSMKMYDVTSHSSLLPSYFDGNDIDFKESQIYRDIGAPEWVAEGQLKGTIPNSCVNILSKRYCKSKIQVENLNKECAWMPSEFLFSVIIGIVLSGQPIPEGKTNNDCTVYIREGHGPKKHEVSPLATLEGFGELPSMYNIPNISTEHNQRLILHALSGKSGASYSQLVKDFREEFLFALLVTLYWVNSTEVSRLHIASLLAGWVSLYEKKPQSGQTVETPLQTQEKEHPSTSEEPAWTVVRPKKQTKNKTKNETKNETKNKTKNKTKKLDPDVSHGFAQWQICMSYALRLNDLLQHPLGLPPCPDISLLFSGVLMHNIYSLLQDESGGESLPQQVKTKLFNDAPEAYELFLSMYNFIIKNDVKKSNDSEEQKPSSHTSGKRKIPRSQQQSSCQETYNEPSYDPKSESESITMAEPEVKKKRTFRKYTFRGVDLDQLLDLSNEQMSELLHCRARRRFKRGLKRKPLALLKKLRKAKKECPALEKPKVVKTHLRNVIIIPEMVGCMVGVYNGKVFNQVEIKPDMIGHYLGEFSITYKPVKHGRPGIGATHSSRFIPLK